MFLLNRFMKKRYPVILIVGVVLLGSAWAYFELRTQIQGETVAVKVGDCTERVRVSRKTGNRTVTVTCPATWTDASGAKHSADLTNATMADTGRPVRAHVLDDVAVKEGTVQPARMIPELLGLILLGVVWLLLVIKFGPAARARRHLRR